jgi:imidazolonepropionase-like amidohydrolase
MRSVKAALQRPQLAASVAAGALRPRWMSAASDAVREHLANELKGIREAGTCVHVHTHTPITSSHRPRAVSTRVSDS